MNYRISLLASALLCLACSYAQDSDNATLFTQQEVPDGIESMIKAMEDNLFFETDISTRVTIETTDPEEGTVTEVFRFFRRDADDYYLALQEKPESRLGTGYLSIDDGQWFYDPESRQFSYRDSREGIGESDTQGSDLQAYSLLDDYRILSAEQTKLGQFDTWLIALEGRNDEVSPPFMRVWISEAPHLLLKEEDYSLTYRLLDTMYIPKYARIDGRYIPEQSIQVNNIVEGRSSKVTLEDISLAPLPDNIFTKAYVERVNR